MQHVCFSSCANPGDRDHPTPEIAMTINACLRAEREAMAPEPAAAASATAARPYMGAYIGEIPARAFGLASVLVPSHEGQHRGNPLWVWAVLSAAERLTCRSYYLGTRGVHVENQQRTIPVDRPESPPPSSSTTTASSSESLP